MSKLLFCLFNIDTGCVELKFSDRSMLSIHCAGVEDAIDTTIYSRAEMDWQIYNDPLSYNQSRRNLGGVSEANAGAEVWCKCVNSN